jgi:hypothetical protein
MPDFSTVATSVVVTLGVQTLYFLVMRLPDQLHRASRDLFELDVLENASYLLSRLSLSESELALNTYWQWKQHFDQVTDKKVASNTDESVLLEQLHPLNSQLGRLRSCISIYDLSGSGDLVTFYISLLDQARTITKNVALNIDEKFNLISAMADLDAAEAQLSLLINRIRLETNVRDLQYQTRMETASADSKDAIRRYLVSSIFLVGSVLALQFPVIHWLTRHHPNQIRLIHWAGLTVPTLCAVTALLAHKFLTSQALINVNKLGGKAKDRIKESEAVFERYAKRIEQYRKESAPPPQV